MPNSSEERMFHVAVVWYVNIHVSNVDVIRAAGPSAIRCSVARNVNLTTHARAMSGLRLRGFLPFSIDYCTLEFFV